MTDHKQINDDDLEVISGAGDGVTIKPVDPSGKPIVGKPKDPDPITDPVEDDVNATGKGDGNVDFGQD
jgi:hypothetical protein